MSFWCLQFSQKTNENNSTWGTIVVKSNFFVHFFGRIEEMKIPKRHFEINWPLSTVFWTGSSYICSTKSNSTLVKFCPKTEKNAACSIFIFLKSKTNSYFWCKKQWCLKPSAPKMKEFWPEIPDDFEIHLDLFQNFSRILMPSASTFPVGILSEKRLTAHSWFLEPWNREKSLTLIWQHFSCLLDEWISKIYKKKFFHSGFSS